MLWRSLLRKVFFLLCNCNCAFMCGMFRLMGGCCDRSAIAVTGPLRGLPSTTSSAGYPQLSHNPWCFITWRHSQYGELREWVSRAHGYAHIQPHVIGVCEITTRPLRRYLCAINHIQSLLNSKQHIALIMASH